MFPGPFNPFQSKGKHDPFDSENLRLTEGQPPDLRTQLEALLDTVWRSEAEWRFWDRLDASITKEELKEKKGKRDAQQVAEESSTETHTDGEREEAGTGAPDDVRGEEPPEPVA